MLTLPRSATGDEGGGGDGGPVAPRRAAPACEVRILELPDEIEASLRLRYDVYHRLGYVTDCTSQLDVDEYDAYAVPLGAVDAATREVVGVLRVLSTTSQPRYREIIHRIVTQADCPALSTRLTRPRAAPLPSIASREVARRLHALCPRDDLPIRELSRYVVRSDRRGVEISRALFELGMATAWQDGPALLIGGCLERHVRAYARYGFRPLRDDGGIEHFTTVGRGGHVVVCHPDDVPEQTRSRIAGIALDVRGTP